MTKLLLPLLLLLLPIAAMAAKAESRHTKIPLDIINNQRQTMARVSGATFPELVYNRTLEVDARELVLDNRRDCRMIRPIGGQRYMFRSSDDQNFTTMFDYGLALYSGMTAEEAHIPEDLKASAERVKTWITNTVTAKMFSFGALEAMNPKQTSIGCAFLRKPCTGYYPPFGKNVRFDFTELCLFEHSRTFDDVKKFAKLRAIEQVNSF